MNKLATVAIFLPSRHGFDGLHKFVYPHEFLKITTDGYGGLILPRIEALEAEVERRLQKIDILLVRDKADIITYHQATKKGLVKNGILMGYSNIWQEERVRIEETQAVFKYHIGGYVDLAQKFAPFRNNHLSDISDLLILENEFDSNHLFVLYGLSGSGKSMLASHLCSYVPRLSRLRKITTRNPRRYTNFDEGTEHVDEKTFLGRCSKKEIIGEHLYKGSYYGYSIEHIEKARNGLQDLITDVVDPKAAINLKQKYPDFVRLIFVDHPYEGLVQRIEHRLHETTKEDVLEQFEMLLKGNIHEYIERMRISSNDRLEKLVEDIKAYQWVIPYADFITGQKSFPENQRDLRTYILENRTGHLE